ncbi:MAG: AtpZ/AtpI family protein [Halanaerobium sp.]|nr:AtpZ/AtpI family protein [Halanaerobium sp.]
MLDGALQTGLVFTLLFAVFGVAAGFWNAYQLAKRSWDKEDEE